jgi:hypothetical protein
MKGKGDKGGKSKGQNAQLAQSEFDSFAFFFLLILFSKFLSLEVSDLKRNSFQKFYQNKHN